LVIGRSKRIIRIARQKTVPKRKRIGIAKKLQLKTNKTGEKAKWTISDRCTYIKNTPCHWSLLYHYKGFYSLRYNQSIKKIFWPFNSNITQCIHYVYTSHKLSLESQHQILLLISEGRGHSLGLHLFKHIVTVGLKPCLDGRKGLFNRV
jgi:hypothetical protein